MKVRSKKRKHPTTGKTYWSVYVGSELIGQIMESLFGGYHSYHVKSNAQGVHVTKAGAIHWIKRKEEQEGEKQAVAEFLGRAGDPFRNLK